MILQYIFYFFLAYLAGGMMFGALIPKVFCGLDIREISKDGNPGTANVFLHAGPFWGILVLICDLLKGFLHSLELLIFWYLLFSLVVIVNPHSLRTGVTYLCWLVSSVLCGIYPVFSTGTFLISAIVLDKHKAELRHLENREIKFIFRRN